MSNSAKAKATRKKQYLLLAGVLLVLVVVSVVAGKLTDNMSPKPHKTPAKSTAIELSLTGKERDAAAMQNKLDVDKLRTAVTELQRRLEESERKGKAQGDSPGGAVAESPAAKPGAENPLTPAEISPAHQASVFTQAGLGRMPEVPRIQPGTNPFGSAEGKANEAYADPPANTATADERSRRILTVNLDQPGGKSEADSDIQSGWKSGSASPRNRNGSPSAGTSGGADESGHASSSSSNGRAAKNYLPAGSFMRGVLLNGMDAPTGGQAQQNPHPVLIRLVDNATLPNRFRANLKDCMITGAGHGDLSSERAYIRLDRLSCVDEQGGAIDVPVKGYVAGEDGKAGLRGTLVSKSGQVLKNALVSGVLSGLGETIKQNAISTQGNAFGIQTQTVENPAQYGIGTGIGKALDQLSQYYVKLADKMFPVIEVDGSRKVDLVLTRGVSIERN